MRRPDYERVTLPPDGKPESDQPRWRRDFPVDWPRDQYVARRDFTLFLSLTSLAFAVGQIWILVRNLFRRRPPTLEQEIVDLAGIPVGGSLVFHYLDENSPRLLVRLDEETFVAFDQLCTHLACPVIPDVAEGRLHCPCHEGFFDLHTGRAIAGPPRRPLPRVELEIRGDKVFAVGHTESYSA